MKAGDTFKIPLPGTSLDSHLWVVISDPSLDSERIVIVNFTSKRADSDLACVLQAKEHPFVHHETVVNYRGAKVVSESDINLLLKSGSLASHAAVSADLLKRIREGVPASRMELEIADILIDEQKLVDC